MKGRKRSFDTFDCEAIWCCAVKSRRNQELLEAPTVLGNRRSAIFHGCTTRAVLQHTCNTPKHTYNTPTAHLHHTYNTPTTLLHNTPKQHTYNTPTTHQNNTPTTHLRNTKVKRIYVLKVKILIYFFNDSSKMYLYIFYFPIWKVYYIS